VEEPAVTDAHQVGRVSETTVSVVSSAASTTCTGVPDEIVAPGTAWYCLVAGLYFLSVNALVKLRP